MDQVHYFGIEDYLRRYILPLECRTTLRRHDTLGDYGFHEQARGILVELLIWLEATAVSLDCPDFPRDEALAVVIAVVHSPVFGLVRVETHRRSCLYGPTCDDSWIVYVNGQHLHAEDRRRPPSPRYTGMIVRRALRDRVVTRQDAAAGALARADAVPAA